MFTKTSNKIILGFLLLVCTSIFALAITFRNNIEPRPTAPIPEKQEGLIGNKNIVSKQIPLNSFDTLWVDGYVPIDIELTSGEGEATLTAAENLVSVVQMNVNNSKLTIRFNADQQVHPSQKLALNIPIQQLHTLISSGENKIYGKELHLDNLNLILDRDSWVNLGLHTQNLHVDLQGNTELHLHGTSKQTVIHTSDKGNLYAGDFESENTTLNIQGSGTIDYNISGKVSLDVASQGKLLFHGAQ